MTLLHKSSFTSLTIASLFFVACSTAPPVQPRSEQEHLDSLYTLVKAANVEGIKDYFHKYGHCAGHNSETFSLFGICPDQMLYLENQRTSLATFLSDLEAQQNQFQARSERCLSLDKSKPEFIKCLATINVLNPFTGRDTVLCREAYKAEDSNCRFWKESDLLFVENAENFGNQSWANEKFMLPLKEKFIASSKIINQENSKNLVVIKQQQEAKYKENEKANEAWNKSGCIFLANFRVKQQLTQKKYLIYTPCFGLDPSTNECNLFAGMMYFKQVPAILVTHSINFTSAGRSQAVYVQKKGTQSVLMEDGFNQVAPIFEEAAFCKDLR